MKARIQTIVYQFAYILELIISILIVAVIIISVIKLGISSVSFFHTPFSSEEFSQFLGTTFSLIIGIEFVKMLCRHTLGSVIEVLMFAMARQLIIEHTSTTENLVGILSIAVLFFIRKYLFCLYDEIEQTSFLPTQSARRVNQIYGVKIPCEKSDTLEDVIHRSLTQDGESLETGSCVCFKGVALRISEMDQGKIKKIEIIRHSSDTTGEFFTKK
jgi:uncharacterized membrane protein (DUF373 family)